MPEGAKNETSPLLAGLKASAVTGGTGLVFGGITGILRSPTPVIWAIVTSIQWGLLGGTYWGFRTAILDTQIEKETTPTTLVWTSGLSGGVSFAVVGGLTRGRHNIIPGSIMGTLFGVTGQIAYNTIGSWRINHESTALLRSSNYQLKNLLNSSWSPVKMLSKEDYEKILNDKLLAVDAEIAIVEEEISSKKQMLTQDMSKPKVASEPNSGAAI